MRLLLLPFYFSSSELLDDVQAFLPRVYKLKVQRVDPWFDPQDCFSSQRGQYDALGLLRKLIDGKPKDADRVLALTSVDLFISVLTYVFGEAQLDGPTGIVSTRRLDPQAYGLPADPARLRQRLLTEAVHELGHNFGLAHCKTPGCAMHGATYVEEIDLKKPALCSLCKNMYQQYMQHYGA